MRTTTTALVATILCTALLTVGCTSFMEMKPSKRIITRSYKVNNFDGLSANTVANIYYTQSTDGKSSVNVSGPDNYVSLLNVTVKNHTLCLEMDRSNLRGGYRKLNIMLTSPSLTDIASKGVGNICIKDRFAVDQLKIESRGTGNIHIDDLACRTVEVYSTGVGNMTLRGKSENTTIESRGVGNIEADNLESAHVIASSHGVGNLTCCATQTLEANVRGVGNIRHRGEPSGHKTINSKGVGSVRPL